MTAALILSASACGTSEKPLTAEGSPIIGRHEITLANGTLSPEALWAMGRIGSSSISPDGKQIAYTVSYYSVKENKSKASGYLRNECRRLE